MPESDDEAQRILRAATVEWLGEFGEAIWSKVLECSGWHYISLTKICEGGAPLAHGTNGKIILPDFDAFKDGRTVFVEAKAKTRSVVYWNKIQERHGINTRNYLHYMEMQRQCGKPCCIGLVELWRESTEKPDLLYWSGCLLFQKLADLIDPRSENPETPPKVYWKRKQFSDWHSFTPTELFALANGSLKMSMAGELEQILFPQKQQPLFA